ncbi:MAG: hypothetical protein J6Z35_07345 [Lachnospiraceae bacterium]|nr:hypothetical protein [Lachnospiraceae bacterium]
MMSLIKRLRKEPDSISVSVYRFLLLILPVMILVTGLSACVSSPVRQQEENSLSVIEISAQDGHGGCFFIRPDGMPAKQKTDFSLRYDDSNLYIKTVCMIPPGEPLRIKGKNPDDMDIFKGECVEIFLCTDAAKGTCYQFAIAPNGCAYTAQGHDKTWEPDGWCKEIRRKNDHWILELTLPYRIFGLSKPKTGEVWGLHFARTFSSVNGNLERSCWCNISDYHDFKRYNHIVFGPAKKLPLVLFDDFQENEEGEVRADLILENVTNPVILNISCGTREFRKRISSHTGKCFINGSFPRKYIPMNDGRAYSLSVRDEKTGKILFHHDIGFDHNYSGLLLPDQLYYLPADKQIRFTLESCGLSEWRKSQNLTVTLASNGKILREMLCSGEGSFSLEGLTPGRYVLEASNGKQRTSRVIYLLEKYDSVSGLPAGSSFEIKGNVFRAGGTPVFLMGSCFTVKPLPEDICFNLKSGNFGSAPNSVQLVGLPGKSYVRNLGCYLYPYPEKDEFFQMISTYMKRVDHDTPKFFRMTYEAQLKTGFQAKGGPLKEVDSAQWHKEFYRYLKANHPDFYYSLQTDKGSSIPELAPHCDIFEVAPAGSYSKFMLNTLLKSLPEVRRIAGEKPLICWLGVSVPDKVSRTVEELRGAVYYNIIHDSAGVIFHLGHGGMPQSRTRIWSCLKHINGEIQSFYPAFRSMKLLSEKESAEILKIEGSHYDCAVRSNGKMAIAVILNRSAGEKVLKIQTDSRYTVTDRFQTSFPNAFEWKLTPFEAAVFLLRESPENHAAAP